jgi:hypothetical protein
MISRKVLASITQHFSTILLFLNFPLFSRFFPPSAGRRKREFEELRFRETTILRSRLQTILGTAFNLNFPPFYVPP